MTKSRPKETRRIFRAVIKTAMLLVMPVAVTGQTGTVTVEVRLAGPAPDPKLLEVTVGTEFCGDEVVGRTVLVDNGMVASAAVSIEGLEGGVQPTEYGLSNVHCYFDPPVTVAGVGGTLLVTNDDDIMHNVHLTLRYDGDRRRSAGNIALPRAGITIRSTRALRWPGVLEVKCDVHAWMHAMIVLFPHPYFSITDVGGAATIKDVPTGSHTVRAWHEVFGELTQVVTVSADAVTPVSFVYSTSGSEAGRSENP